MNRSATVMLQLINYYRREKAREEKKHKRGKEWTCYEEEKGYLNDYIIGDRQIYSDGRLVVSFSHPQPTEFTLDGLEYGIPYNYNTIFKKFRTNDIKIAPPSVGILKSLKKQCGNKSQIAFYLGDRETSIDCKEYVIFSVDLLQKMLEMIPLAEMYLFSNLTDEFNGVYGAAYFKNKFGDEGILAPIRGTYFDAILMHDGEPLWTYDDYKKFENAV